MRPEDLIPPFPREEKKIFIHDRVWYLPYNQLDKTEFFFPGWQHSDLFGNTNPVQVEYCSGNGAWIAAQAMAHPELNWIAVERKFNRVRKIWSKIKNHHLNNLLVICGEAFQATQSYFPSDSIANIYINFPDPWPKNKHAKNRLIQPTFVQELWRIMQIGHTLTFVTDHPKYSQETIKEFLAHPHFHSQYPDPYFSTDESDYGSSYFEALWRAKGKSIRYHRFIKNESR